MNEAETGSSCGERGDNPLVELDDITGAIVDAAMKIHIALPNRYFDQLGLPRLAT